MKGNERIMLQQEKIGKVIAILIDITDSKLKYAIARDSLVQGLRDTFANYNIPYTKEVHEQLVEAVQTKLEGPDFEREWTEEEYENFVIWKLEYETKK